MVFHTPKHFSPRDAPPQAETRVQVYQESALLKLPTEVFQTITWHMDVGTYFSSLLTCKQFYEAAKSRHSIFRQLNRIPGLKLGLSDLSTPDLLLQLRRRASESGCAALVLANVTIYAQQPGKVLSNAVLSLAEPSEPNGSLAQLVTTHGNGTLQIYDITRHHIRQKVELQIRPIEEDCTMEIIKMAISPVSLDLGS